MHLIKLFRKNKSKIMVVVIFIAIIGFIGGSYIQNLAQRSRGTNRVVAHFLDSREITNYDMALAQQELEVLLMLQADRFLRNIPAGIMRIPDLQAFFLGELLFSDPRMSSGLINSIKKIIQMNNYCISDKQLNDIYRRSERSNVFWLLLKREAELSGIRISKDDTRRVLVNLFRGQQYQQAISATIKHFGISEDRIIETFGKLLAVLEYSGAICSAEDTTIRQVMNTISLDEETIDAEFVQFETSLFSDRTKSPTEEQIQSHFDKYKNYFEDDISEENPYGFGYKLHERASLEYIIVKLDDIASIVTSPTEEEKEQYYQIHKREYAVQELTDPNDPNSEPIERIERYWEVANIIEQDIRQKRIDSKSREILQKAGEFVEAGLGDKEPANLSVEELKKLSGDYREVAQKLSDEYKVKIYSGKTGLLDAVDMQLDGNLGMLYIVNPNYNLTSLIQIVFAIDELAASELGVFDSPKPLLYGNIGPLEQMGSFNDTSGKIMAMVRLCRAEKAVIPDLDLTYDTTSVILDEQQQPSDKTTYSVKQKVIDDLKNLAALKTAKANAEQLVELVKKDSWKAALKQINKLYGKTDQQEIFTLRTENGLTRTSQKKMETLKILNQGKPLGQFMTAQAVQQAAVANDFYSFVGDGKEMVENVPLIMESKSDMSYYVIKNLSVKRVDIAQYEQLKTVYAYTEDIIQSQSLAAVHYNPLNILKRLNFRIVVEESESREQPETEGI